MSQALSDLSLSDAHFTASSYNCHDLVVHAPALVHRMHIIRSHGMAMILGGMTAAADLAWSQRLSGICTGPTSAWDIFSGLVRTLYTCMQCAGFA